ncbi:MAG: VanZ family protein, partial [Desulfobacteraceae bacterium]|nr:VanZ family protein [Desulfobacteraceae bacterium]
MNLKIIDKYWRSILCSIIIMVLCFIPGDELPQPKFDIPYLDKIVHFCFYFVLSLTIQYEIKKNIKLKNYLFIFIYAMVLGGLIEVIQETFIVERGGDFFDLIADLLGAVIAFIFYKIKPDSIVVSQNLKKGLKLFIFLSLILLV